MNSVEARPVYITAASVLNAAGCECSGLHGRPPVPQPLEFDPDQLAYSVAVPCLQATVFDRKVQRGVEAQGARILYCAGLIAGPLRDLNLSAERIALMAAIPEVDGPSSCWNAVQAISEQPDALLEQLFAHTPPLHALMMLNSSAMAYVAEALDCRGPMGGYCSQGNAGVDAVIEAFEQIAAGRADASVVVSSSPNLSPALYLRESIERPINANSLLYGEGAAALLLTSLMPTNTATALRVAGFARGYSGSTGHSGAVVHRVIQRALSRENLCLNDIGRIITDPLDPALTGLFGDRVVQNSALMTGDLGASTVLTDVALALHEQADGYTLLLNQSRAGHWSALLLVSETMEAKA